MASLPTKREINVYDSLDERCAVKHFLGKDLDQAEAMFREDFLCYQEDLMWMGPRAFCFYVRAAVAYLLSPEADGDSAAVSSFLLSVDFQLEQYRDAVQPTCAYLDEAIQAILDRFDRFNCDPAIYGDVRGRYIRLQELLRLDSLTPPEPLRKVIDAMLRDMAHRDRKVASMVDQPLTSGRRRFIQRGVWAIAAVVLLSGVAAGLLVFSQSRLYYGWRHSGALVQAGDALMDQAKQAGQTVIFTAPFEETIPAVVRNAKPTLIRADAEQVYIFLRGRPTAVYYIDQEELKDAPLPGNCRRLAPRLWLRVEGG